MNFLKVTFLLILSVFILSHNALACDCDLELLNSIKENIKKDNVPIVLMTIAKSEWPDDYRMQLWEYERQKEGLIFMLNATDEELRKIAITNWPCDFSMMKWEYEKQLEAKNKLKELSN